MKKVFLIFIIILWLPQISSASVCSQVRAGNRFYEQENYSKALERYQQALKKNENSDIVNFNLGAALYKNEEYEQAIAHFHKALLSEEKSLRQKVQYNLGNTFYKHGIKREEADLNFAIQSLEQGLEFYAQAIVLQPEDAKAHHNYEFVKSELERLKEKQQQQQQQQQDKTCPLPKDEPDSEQQDDQPQPRPQDQPSEQTRDKDASEQSKEPDQSDEESRSSSAAQEQESKSPEQSSQENSDARQDQDRMSEHEAHMRLEHYQRSEEPRGLLNLNPNRRDDPVDKDW